MEYLKRFILLLFTAAPVAADDNMSESGSMMTTLNLECTMFVQKVVNNRPLKEPVMEVGCGVNGSSLIQQAYFFPQLRPFDNRYNSGDPIKSPLLIKQAGKPGFTFSLPLGDDYASCRIEGFSNTRGCSPASFDDGQPGTLYMDFPIQLPGTQGSEHLGDGSYCRFVCARSEMTAAEEPPLDITDFSTIE